MSESDDKAAYRVLARKYRPRNLDELVGQDALVRTLRNAINSGRIAHAFMLTGIRGIGKTTTARIIARALNYTGPDGTAGPTAGPTDDCAVCRAIAEDRHPDVMEMDAASRTGIDDIREILDGVRYAPTSARYKVYIIDEVHMLSKAAFNALLKTLEEPPPHVKFIFATTEIRKVPVTVLSRCQRFDLRRVDASVLSEHYKRICGLENTPAEDEAIALISRAADGSVRDGLSLLDQAIALGGGNVTAQLVKDMLGLADRARVIDLLDHALKGECPAALDVMDDLYRSGADPLVVMQDLLELVHILTRLRAVPQSKDSNAPMARDAMERAAVLAAQLSMPTLGRAWQILLKGINEVAHASNAQTAAEMVVIRLAYAADLPDPADLIKKLKSGEFVAASSGTMLPSATRSPEPVALRSISGGGGGASAAVASLPQEQEIPALQIGKIETLEDIVALLRLNREIVWAEQVFHFVRPVKIEPGRLEFHPAPKADTRLAQELTKLLTSLSGQRWMVSVSSATGGATLAELQTQSQQAALDEVKKNPLVADILTAFPDASLKIIER